MTEVLMSLWRGEIRIRPKHKLMREIAAEVAEEHGLSTAELMGKSRVHRIAHARQEAIWRMRHETANSLPKIAGFFGFADHTNCMHAVKAVERRRACS